jgi:hypothetical protein
MHLSFAMLIAEEVAGMQRVQYTFIHLRAFDGVDVFSNYSISGYG